MSNDRKQEIMEAAIRIFSRKGFNGSTMQDVADACGMSKATLYQHYKSKDQLLLSIFYMVNDRIYYKLQSVMHQGDFPAEECLRQQIELLIRDCLSHCELIRMLHAEHPNAFNDEIMKASGEIQARMISHFERMLRLVYGPRVEPYGVELVFVLMSLLDKFNELMILQNVVVNVKELSDYIMKLLGFMAEGLMENGVKPIMSEHNRPECLRSGSPEPESDSVEGLICRMYRNADLLRDAGKAEQDIRNSILMLDHELKSPSPRRFIVQGMLHNLLGTEELRESAECLTRLPEMKHYID
ncbi:TetR/AcrR family transcriptional regulator [Paenibacillus azoreducens]|uniref:HTH-type transcriptional regulator YuxN n=1 Tax=Paenibacillus azoreducens TaxID=116718 RepID=A0A919Y9I4_9BACL|nr:TetR/AcrR family transcriptional regulator [Paenibacillus azoreducens]GIO46669.1 putative HTH-type transcriptional regulator YuxN [Paenibacillus azoreducens]